MEAAASAARRRSVVCALGVQGASGTDEVTRAAYEVSCLPIDVGQILDADDSGLMRSVIGDVDVAILVIGDDDACDGPRLATAERMLDDAVACELPVLAFVHARYQRALAEPSRSSDESGPYQRVLTRLEAASVTIFAAPSELGSAVSRSLVRLGRIQPSARWVRADAALDIDRLEQIRQLGAAIVRVEEERRTPGVGPPPGADRLCWGDDLFHIEFRMKIDRDSSLEDGRYFGVHTRSWNWIFSALFPQLIERKPEADLTYQLKQVIAHELNGRVGEFEDAFGGLVRGTPNFLRSSIADRSWHEIVVQLVALGLIETAQPKRRSVKDTATYWRMTSLGRAYAFGLVEQRWAS